MEVNLWPLVAGVHSDESIEEVKGAPTVMTHAERVEIVEACRWVNEVAPNLPYAVPVSLLDQLRCARGLRPRGFPG